MDKEKNELSYWNEQLKNLNGREKFIWDYCDESIYKKSIYKEVLVEEYGNKLSDVCKDNSLLIYIFLVSTLKITLSKYMNKKDIVIGIPFYSTQHNRGNVNINKLLPLVSYIDYEETYLEYMDSIKTKVLGSYKNQVYLNSKILLQNGLPNDVMEFTTISACMKGLHDDKDINYICESSKNELSFLLDPMEDKSIGIQMVYNSNKITEVTVKALHESYITALKDILNNYNKKIKDVKILSEKDAQKILYEFNDTKVDYPKDKTIHELFETQVEKTPDNIAVVFEDKKLTYRELNERANSLARILRDKGVKADSIVGIMVERSLEMIIGLMGILKAGGAYLPIDPNYPKERIEYMLKDSESKILLSKNTLVENIEFDGEFIDLFNETLFGKNLNNLNKMNNSTNLVYIIYTSGTTGNPKGVMIEHRNLNNLILGLNKNIYQKYNRFLRIGLVSPYYFDASVKQIFAAILNGHSLYIVGEEIRRDGEKLFKYYEEKGIEIADGTPMNLKMMINSNLFKKNKLAIEHYIIGGEKLKLSVVKDFYRYIKKNDGPCISNVYGPTECCVDSSVFLIDAKTINGLTDIPIGKPMVNYKLYIVNNYNQEMPIGIPGELCISGDGLARGYLNKLELTAEKFVDNPFESGTKMYKTGDLARWLPDGNIEFLGRIDNQVKIRGFRIELGEIENSLMQNESVKETVVVAKENKDGEKYICAYVVTEKALEELNLKSYLKETLPEYMVPSYFVRLEKMPITTNGKLDRRALPEPNLDTALSEYEAPRNEVEETLSKIWSEVLCVDKVGINDNFFDIGGHSLKATMLMSKIHKELNKEVPLKELFKSPTIKELSKYIASAEENLYSNIEKVGEKEYYEASSAQKRMYMLQQFDKNSIAYNMPAVFELEGKVDKNKIEETFRKLTERHETLRTYFETFNSEIIQKLQNNYKFNLVHRSESTNIEEIINDFVGPFNLEKVPLFRVELVESKEKTYLLIDMHHIISDGVSMSILINDFTEVYGGKTLEPLKLQYKDFTAWQNNFLRSEEMKKQEEYWINRFSDEIPVLNMPTDYERPAIQSFEGDSVSFEVDEDTTLRLRKLTKETGTTMHMVLISAFNILISKYSGQEDIVIGTPIAGRAHADIQNIIGMFVNTLALRNKPEGDKKYIDFLKEVKENSLKAYENQSYQLEALVENLDLRRDTSRNPLFDVMFNMVDTVNGGDIKLDDIILKQYNNGNKISKFDLTLNAVESDAKINFSIEYCSKLFKIKTIERLSTHYVKILNSIVNNVEIKLNEVNLLSEAEKNQILYEFNDTKIDYPKDKTIQELFEEQVEKTPNNIAVVFEDKRLTYRELNEKSNGIARVLRDKGVKTDSIVGIMVERSLEMIVGIMGILKAGGAYLPIDPSYPKERIEYMLKDSKCEVLLTVESSANNIEFTKEVIDLFNEDWFEGDLSNLEKINNSSNLAYVIYTSGTTGKPKGVMIEHRNVINTLIYMQDNYPVVMNDVYLFKTNYTFDVSVAEIFGYFMGGGTLAIVNDTDSKDINAIINAIKKYEVTHINFVPAMLNMFIELTDDNYNKVANLKYVFAAGEELKANLVFNFYNKFNNIALENVYGPTEASIYATKYSTSIALNGNSVPIGTPINNTKIYILDTKNNHLPIGVVGELCISGDGLARGYLNRPDLTAEKFVDNPFEAGIKMYKTGDLARWLPDGNIEFLG
uniref:amino acid adenylation domain-containing protein n=1 Tax=Clostridium sp. TaxID=1506 RepID=UPI0032163CAE